MQSKTLKLTTYLLLGLVSIIGDKLVSYNNNNHFLKAVIDNTTHGIVAGLSWTLIVILQNEPIAKNLPSILFCTFLSSLIDIDHFVEAKSFNIKDATNLERRPFFHCTTLPIIIWAVLLVVSKVTPEDLFYNLNYCAWILLTSFLSHHIRDATRRGLWVPPFGSTGRIPYYFYVLLAMLFPYFVYLSMEKHQKIVPSIHIV
ncbi:transmembrane protein 267 [Cotesia typhae]|uniref:transmembrane protein 267 n=1 Tax=Cotesia typhae TaxID=2053667 RepID=UPI003D691120